jgi:hypothetical protein
LLGHMEGMNDDLRESIRGTSLKIQPSTQNHGWSLCNGETRKLDPVVIEIACSVVVVVLLLIRHTERGSAKTNSGATLHGPQAQSKAKL